MVKAYIALGSNLDNPVQQITQALHELDLIQATSVVASSSLYQNPPIGMTDQPEFINAVAAVITELSSLELMHELQCIEAVHQRERSIKNGPRTLDLDLLLHGNEEISSEHLHLPHPRMKERNFVIFPLLEIEPDLILPCGSLLRDLSNKLCHQNLRLVLNNEVAEAIAVER